MTKNKEKKKKCRSKKKVFLRTLCGLLAAVLLLSLSYLLYVVIAYYRVDDDQPLTVAGNATEKLPVSAPLTLVTYNVGFGAYSDDYSFFMDGGEHARAFSREAVLENIAGAIQTIKRANPDLLLLQEVDTDGTRSYHVDQSDLFATALSDFDRIYAQNYDSPYFLYPFTQPIGANRSGMMTFSRYHMTGATRYSLPVEDSLHKYLDLDRAYTVSVIPTENGKCLMLYNLHLSAYTSDGSIADEQMRLLAADMAAAYAEGHYVVAAGDFNKDLLGNSGDYFTRPTDETYNWAKPFDTALLPDGFTCHTGENAPTCRNADAPYRGDGSDFVLSVDGMLTSANVEVVSCRTLSTGFSYSDHDPVRLQFILKAD